MFGEPRNLVSDTIRRISGIAMESGGGKARLILMSTTAYTNLRSGEKNGIGEKIILSILKLLLPPHRDNMLAAEYLQERVGKDNGKMEWVAVRPDTLVDEVDDAAYELSESPVRSPIFDAGKTSRTNVSRFIADLLASDSAWQEWRFKMPVIYNGRR